MPQTRTFFSLSLSASTFLLFLTAFAGEALAEDVLTIDPPAANTIPSGTIRFNATGGSGGYKWSIPDNRSSGWIDAYGNYRAGVFTSVDDLVRVTDSEGSTATALVHVDPFDPLVVAPKQVNLAPRATQVIAPSGGYPPYRFSYISNASLGILQSSTYIAGPKGGLVDLVRVTDEVGQTTVVTFVVGAQITVQPTGSRIAPRAALTFSAEGGSGVGFAWSFVDNRSGGTIDPVTGAYAAGPNTHSVDVVRATDSLGNVCDVTVSVGGGIAVEPFFASIWPLGTLPLSAIGGSGTFTWTLVSSPSGGSIEPATGIYRAGPIGGVSDEVEVLDSLGNRTPRTITVGPSIQLSPPSSSVGAGDTVLFSVSGGSGRYVFLGIEKTESEATLNTDFVYRAGNKSGRDTIFIRDSEGSVAKSTVDVTAAPASDPTTSSLPSSASPPRIGVAGGGADGCATRSRGGSGEAGAGAGAVIALGLIVAARRRRAQT